MPCRRADLPALERGPKSWSPTIKGCGLAPNRSEPRRNFVEHLSPPWVGSRSPEGWDQIPYRLGGWVLHQPPWSFGLMIRFPNERNQGKQAHPVLKYRVSHGSQCVMSRLIHTGLGSSSLIAHVLHSPPPREQLCDRSCK